MKKLLAICLCIGMIFRIPAQALAFDTSSVDTAIKETAQYLLETVNNPQISTVGGEWTVLGLARSGVEIPQAYFQQYYENVQNAVIASGGVLHKRKYTEYARVALALSAIGKNPQEVAGFCMLAPLGDYKKTVWQGVNGSVWALLSLDCKGYEIPMNTSAEVQATRDLYLAHILEHQTADGGWTLSGEAADPDMTAMTLQALSAYQNRAEVAEAIQKALTYLSRVQKEDGGFTTVNTETAESCAQAIVALCSLGISPEDKRFVKNGNTVVDALMQYRTGQAFRHTKNDIKPDLMATEQGFYALVAYQRFYEGKSGLYQMTKAPQQNVRSLLIQFLETLFMKGKVYEQIQK
ncbi:MAG: hypothetical protein E7397_01950 [Ruminococcaceae bacterium]|nr:hypothetical protein [Oscillospiraceae bacterium]